MKLPCIPNPYLTTFDKDSMKLATLGSQGITYVLLSDPTGLSNIGCEISSPASGWVEVLTPLEYLS